MAAQFLLNGTNAAALASPLSPDSGSGYVLIPDGTTHTYSTAQAYQGTASLVGTGSAYVWVDDGGGWPYTTDNTSTYVDFFFYMPGAPASDQFVIGGAYLATAGLYVTTDRRLAFKDSGGTVRGQTAANAVPTSTWVRIRVRYHTTNGIDNAWLWTSNFTTDDPTTAGATTLTATASMHQGFIAINPGGQYYLDDIVIAPTASGDPTHPAGVTTHNGTAALTATSTLTTAGTRTAAGAAALAASSALTAAATATRPATASLTAAATLTVSAGGATSAAAALAAASILTASATATGSADASAALTSSASLTVSALRALFGAVSLTAVATLTSAATASTPGAVTPGVMRAVEIGAPHMSVAREHSTSGQIVALTSVDAATMTLVFSTTAQPSDAGIAIFSGGTLSPGEDGRATPGEPYLWISGGTIYYEDGS